VARRHFEFVSIVPTRVIRLYSGEVVHKGHVGVPVSNSSLLGSKPIDGCTSKIGSRHVGRRIRGAHNFSEEDEDRIIIYICNEWMGGLPSGSIGGRCSYCDDSSMRN